MVILALDPDTKQIGCALRVKGQWRTWTVDLKPPKGEERSLASLVRERLCEKLPVMPDAVATARPHLRFYKDKKGRSRPLIGSYAALQRLQGIIEGVFSQIPVVPIMDSEAQQRWPYPLIGDQCKYLERDNWDDHQIAALRLGLCLAEDIAEAKESEHETDKPPRI